MTTSTSQSPLLAVRNVSVRFGALAALTDASVEVAPSELCGLIGPNGAGKTTLFNVVTGFREPNSGSVWFDGRELASSRSWPPHARSRLGIRRTFQEVELFETLTVRDNLVAAVQRKHRAKVGDILDEFGLTEVADALCLELPSGVRRIVGVARAIADRPKILLLDEPGAGLSLEEVLSFAETVKRACAESHCAVLVVDHDLELIRALCDKVYVLDFGKIISVGTPAEVEADQSVVTAYIGE